MAQKEILGSKWDVGRACAQDPVDLLVYRSNLLGSDERITNFGGGNTSAKIVLPDPLTSEPVKVLWVKGSGGDLGTMKRSGLASLYLDRVLALERIAAERGITEDEIVPLYSHCTFGLNPTTCSIDTPLHAFVPYDNVDHMHPDAVIAIAASDSAEALTQDIFGGEVGFLPWKRPGFELGLMLRGLLVGNPKLKGAVMGSHGLISWADDSQMCYERTLDLINRAAEAIGKKPFALAFGNEVRARVVPDADQRLGTLLPELRGKVEFEGRGLIAHVDRSGPVLDFLASEKMLPLSRLGTSCPDHFLRTKIAPMVLEGDLDASLEGFRKSYAAYYDRCKRPDSPAMRNPNPSVVLIPSVGMVTFGKTKQEAIVTSEFYRRAIEVMRGAESLSRYTALPEQEAFDIEYWLLEEAKLRRMPPEKEFSRKVAFITGGAQGIGFATATRLAAVGACVAVVDINETQLAQSVEQLGAAAGSKVNVLPLLGDVTNTTSLESAMERTILEFGGIDIGVICAGNARRGTVADTSDDDYEFQSSLLMKAYFTTMRSLSQLMIRQGTGGAMVVVASKNGVAVGSNAAVYSAAKAFELHLMRTAASDLAKHKIRCNAVNPDAVLQGSGIWNDQWRAQTAASLGIKPAELEEHYRKRALLGVTVSASDVAEAIAWLASDKRSSRTTGCTIPIDGGVREGFLR